MAPYSLNNATIFRMIWVSFNHIADTQRNITRKYRISCYKEYRVRLCSDNVWNSIYITAILTKFYTIFLTISMKYIWNGTGPVSKRLLHVKIYYFCLKLRASWRTLQGNKIKCYKTSNDNIYFRETCVVNHSTH